MKIIQVCPRYHPYVGGVERVVKNISEYLARMNQEVTVYATDPSNTLPRIQVINGVKLRNYPALAPNEDYHFPHLNMLLQLLGEQTDVIHVHSVHDLTALTAYMAHNLNRKPKFIVSPYYHRKGHTKLAQILWAPYRPIVGRILRNADAIIVNSRTQRDAINRTFKSPSKISVVYDGVNLNEIKNAKSFTVNDNHTILLYVGRLEKYKNIHITIESMKYLPKNYHFYIIGRGSFKPFLENLVQSVGLQSRVHFLGFQPDSIVYRWLTTAHVFVHLSAVESFGMTCIESLAAGTPVTANDDGFGLSETVALFPEHIRMYSVSKEPVSKLARLIMEVAELKPITADVLQFSWDSIAESISTVYKEILRKR